MGGYINGTQILPCGIQYPPNTRCVSFKFYGTKQMHKQPDLRKRQLGQGGGRVMGFNSIFSNISVIWWRSVLLVEEIEVNSSSLYIKKNLQQLLIIYQNDKQFIGSGHCGSLQGKVFLPWATPPPFLGNQNVHAQTHTGSTFLRDIRTLLFGDSQKDQTQNLL